MTQAAYELVLLLASIIFMSSKRTNYYDQAISFGELYKGLKKSCRNVRWKDSVVGYETNGLRNTFKLSKALHDGTYRISKYQIFQIHEPKERTIVASRIVDRQFQRSLCECGLYDDITEHFIRDNVACQKGKGTDDALNRLKIHLHRYYRKYGHDGWVLKCDVHHYFPETRHDIVKKAVQKYVSDPRAAKAVCDVIDSFEGDVGIGLGSQISQLIELLLLNDLDHYIKERLHIKYYIRYMDDFVLIHQDKEYLKYCWREIDKWLTARSLHLNEKTEIQPLRHGIIFLKWRFVLTETGKVLMLMKPEKLSKQRHRLKKLHEKELVGKVDAGATEESLQSFLANAKRGQTYLMQKRMIAWYNDLTGGTYHDRQVSSHETRRGSKCHDRAESSKCRGNCRSDRRESGKSEPGAESQGANQ